MLMMMEMSEFWLYQMPLSWRWYCTVVLEDVTIGENWVKGICGDFSVIFHSCVWHHNYGHLMDTFCYLLWHSYKPLLKVDLYEWSSESVQMIKTFKNWLH